MPRRARPTFLTVVVAAVVALSGCGGDGGPATSASTGAASRAGVALTPVGDFQAPVHLAQPPGERRRLFVVEQGGTIRVVRDGRTLEQPFLDLSAQVRAGGEQGLLSVAFAPDYADSGLFYVYYTDREGDTQVVEYRRATADRADPASARTVLSQEQPEPNHNGGQLQFGPDGLLYVGLGDGGGQGDQHGATGNGQDLGTWLGKVLRIDPRPSGGQPYGVPADNPFLGRDEARPEIYAWGLRNPWRFSFDRRTGDVAIADVGQSEREEVSFRRRGEAAGANFGWRAWEGTNRYDDDVEAPGHVPPALEYGRDGGACSITGGYVVRDPRLPALDGRYVYGDHCVGDLLSARLAPDGSDEPRPLGLNVPNLSSFGEDGRGRLYALSLDGSVYRLDPR